MAIADEKLVSVTTQPSDGEAHRTRVVLLGDGRIALLTPGGLVTDGDLVTVQAAGSDTPPLHGSVQVVRSGRAFDEAVARARKKYGWRARVSHIHEVVLVTAEP